MPAVTQDGHIYGVPTNFGKTILFYRADLFRQAGLDPNRPPRNWDELYSTAQRLTSPSRQKRKLASMSAEMIVGVSGLHSSSLR